MSYKDTYRALRDRFDPTQPKRQAAPWCSAPGPWDYDATSAIEPDGIAYDVPFLHWLGTVEERARLLRHEAGLASHEFEALPEEEAAAEVERDLARMKARTKRQP